VYCIYSIAGVSIVHICFNNWCAVNVLLVKTHSGSFKRSRLYINANSLIIPRVVDYQAGLKI